MIPISDEIGSSPRTWGTHPCSFSDYSHLRFIPTYMGNAAGATPTPDTLPVHPHVHGERMINLT